MKVIYATKDFTYSLDITRVKMSNYTDEGNNSISILQFQHNFTKEEEGVYMFFINLIGKFNGSYYLLNKEGEILMNEKLSNRRILQEND